MKKPEAGFVISTGDHNVRFGPVVLPKNTVMTIIKDLEDAEVRHLVWGDLDLPLSLLMVQHLFEQGSLVIDGQEKLF